MAASRFPPVSPDRLRSELREEGVVDVYLSLSSDQIRLAKAEEDYKAGHEIRIMKLDYTDDRVTLFPIVLLNNVRFDFLEPRYKGVRSVTLHKFGILDTFDLNSGQLFDLDILDRLPSGFVKDYNISLGLAYGLRFIIEEIEELTEASEVLISRHKPTGFDKSSGVFTLSFDDYEALRKSIQRISDRAQNASSDVKTAMTHNLLAKRIGSDQIPVRARRHQMTKTFQDALEHDGVVDASDQDALVSVMMESAESIAKRDPEKLHLLRDELQLVTLDALISKLESMLSERLGEAAWQRFFVDNSFILSLAFGHPIVQVEGHASVGGKKLSGRGEKITDFLYRHDLTGNAALFEIKTPETDLLEKKPYRDGIFGPSKHLSGAVAQVLDQRFQFQLSFATKKTISRIDDLESYAVECCIIVGRIPTDKDQQKSLEIIRGNSKDVRIVTFDELLEKLKQIRNLLATAHEE
jgi:hypothetical protein